MQCDNLLVSETLHGQLQCVRTKTLKTHLQHVVNHREDVLHCLVLRNASHQMHKGLGTLETHIT